MISGKVHIIASGCVTLLAECYIIMIVLLSDNLCGSKGCEKWLRVFLGTSACSKYYPIQGPPSTVYMAAIPHHPCAGYTQVKPYVWDSTNKWVIRDLWSLPLVMLLREVSFLSLQLYRFLEKFGDNHHQVLKLSNGFPCTLRKTLGSSETGPCVFENGK